MLKTLVPKISNRNVAKLSTVETDYLLGDIDIINVLDYSDVIAKPVELIDKTNDFEFNGFKYLATIFSSNYYIQQCCSVNTGIAAILKAICPHFALIRDDLNKNKFIGDFFKSIAIELEEKALFKSLHCGHYKLKRKMIIKSLLETKDYDIYPVFKYLALRFKYGLTILEDDTFHTIYMPENRKSIILLKNNNIYYLLCSKSGDNNLYDADELKNWIGKVKLNLFKLEDISKYKVGELRDICKKNNIDISTCQKKDDIYTSIKKWLQL
jgi:hypothetical protein